MLRFILVFWLILLYHKLISIHPMLRFIETFAKEHPADAKFQYIPCYGLSYAFNRWCVAAVIFQYIPCYGLSTAVVFQQSSGLNFNTSHVTVYHKTAHHREEEKMKFQYIPCYGLSNDFKPFLSWHLSSFPLFYVISAFFTSRL